MLIDLLADKHRLDGFVNFLTQIIELCSYNISRGLVFQRQDKADRILHVGLQFAVWNTPIPAVHAQKQFSISVLKVVQS